MTLAEEIEIFIYRCLQNRYRHDSMTGCPLYCLIFPEDLNISVLDKVTDLFVMNLMSNNEKTKNYALVVISCNESNSLSHLLQVHKINNGFNSSHPHMKRSISLPVGGSINQKPQPLMENVHTLNLFQEEIKKNSFTLSDGVKICNTLFNSNNILKSNKLFISLYKSDEFGAGKSFIIQQKAQLINASCAETNIIRIPFNGSKVDLDFVVSRLFKCYDGIQRRKIIYHIDISSSASDEINCLLFNLLFLKHISTTKNRCFSITND
eukprot:90355_1